MRAPVAIACVVLMASGLAGQARQDTASARQDTTTAKTLPADSLKTSLPTPAKPKAKYQIDTTFDALNLERLYYGMDGPDAGYESNPWDDYLFQDADGRDEDERDQRDQERDSRE
jgi:hypothetical protein